MLATLARILPLALTAAINPTGLLLVMSILSSKEDPGKKSRSFLLGALMFLIVLGLLITFTFHPAVQQAKNPNRISAAIDVLLGLLIFLALGISKFGKRKDKPKKKQRKRPFAVIGFLYMLLNASTLIPFIAATKIISDQEPGFWDKLPLFAVLVLITMSMISLPVIVSSLFPEQAERVLGPLKSFMARHGRTVADVFFLAMAVYLFIYGARRI